MSNYELTIKEVDPTLVAIMRAVVPTQADIPANFDRMFGQTWQYVAQHNAAADVCSISIYYDEEFTGRDMHVGAAVPVTSEIPETDEIAVTHLPGALMAATTHVGPFRFLSQAFDALAKLLHEAGYRIVGPCREVYLSGDPSGDQMECVTEVQFPVAKA